MQDKKIQQVICGGYHLFILKESGELFAFGWNEYGQLGLSNNENRNVPTLLMKDKEIRQIICGDLHSFILKESDELFAFGYNYNGQLGLGDNENRKIPTLLMKTGDDIVPSLNLPVRDKVKDNTIQQIICGSFHSFIFKESGELFAFGFNSCGQLGLGDNNNRNTPTLLGTFDNIVSINGVILQIKWNPDIYATLSKTKKREIKNFLLVCHYYKLVYKINVVKYMRHVIISLLF